MDRKLNNRGFTLVELMVVIAIISLLLSIILPSLNRIKQSLRKTTCKFNLKNIGIGIQLYLNDNKGCFYQNVNANVKYGGWEGMIFLGEARPINPYLSLPGIPQSEDQAKIFRCDEDRGGLMGKSIPLYSYIGTSYQTNHFLIGPDHVGAMPNTELQEMLNKKIKDLKISEVNGLDKLILVGDYGWLNQYRPSVPLVGEWHHKTAFHNIVFMDGHVDFIKIIKGLYVTAQYSVLPNTELNSIALRVQQEEN